MASNVKDSSVDHVDFKFGGSCFTQKGDGFTKIDQNEYYKMDNPNRGVCVIINNRDFDSRTGMSKRNGTDLDASSLEALFGNVGFEIIRRDNQSVDQMLNIVLEVGKRDHTNNDCLVIVVLSHGERDILYGCDGTVTVDDLLSPIKKSSTLIGKPKFMIFQACRGTGLDDGHDVAFDGPDDVASKIPVEADYLYAYSTVPGYYSWRNSFKGSWFVQAFVNVFKDNTQCDMLSLMTKVNRQVAFDFQSNAANAAMNKKKQVPYIASTLTKTFYLFPKN